MRHDPKPRRGVLARLFSRAPAVKASAAKPLIAFHAQGRPVWTARSYEALAREGYAKNPVVFRCVRMIAETAASVPLKVMGEDADAVFRLERLLGRPNPHQAPGEFLECLYGHLQLAGDGYVEAVSLSGRVRELYVLRPDRVKAIPGASGWPEGYEYGVDGRTVRLMTDPATGFAKVLHLRQFHPLNDHYGMSPLEAAATAVDVHNAAMGWNKSLLDNAARPSGALVYAGPDGASTLTDDQFDRLKAQLQEEHMGAAAAGRPLLLEGGLDWKPMSLSPADMDFMQAKHGAARDVALAFGVPPMLLGIPGDNTYANYREAQLAFWRQTVTPLVKKTATALSRWLAPQFSAVQVAPDLDAVPALGLEREALWARLEAASFLSTQEKRAFAGLEPSPADVEAGR